MRHFSRLQITDLEHIESVVELELTVEESEKIVGGRSKSVPSANVIIIIDTGITNSWTTIRLPCRTASSFVAPQDPSTILVESQEQETRLANLLKG